MLDYHLRERVQAMEDQLASLSRVNTGSGQLPLPSFTTDWTYASANSNLQPTLPIYTTAASPSVIVPPFDSMGTQPICSNGFRHDMSDRVGVI